MDESTKQKLIFYAQKYETSSFLNEDPSQFIRWYSNPSDVESASFIAAMLSFGSRKQFIPKIKNIFTLADKAGGIVNWLESGQYKKDFPSSEAKYYRFYSFSDMNDLFFALELLLKKYKSIGSGLQNYCQNKQIDFSLVQGFFQTNFEAAAIVPKGKNSANKRLHMFLRWMVRQNSPVDTGLWNWYPQSELIIPLDVHVMEEAKKLGLLSEKCTPSLKTAKLLTIQLKQIWPEDPCKGDFALFGKGVEQEL